MLINRISKNLQSHKKIKDVSLEKEKNNDVLLWGAHKY